MSVRALRISNPFTLDWDKSFIRDGPTTQGTDGTTTVDTVTVADFILYPLAGVHPHVHRRAGTQYVIVRTNTSVSDETLRERLMLELDGEAVPLASRQPVPWSHDTLDVAFAASKETTIDSGQVLFGQSSYIPYQLPRLSA